jgi:KDO2-lipid IV(A) lauroyltransferase
MTSARAIRHRIEYAAVRGALFLAGSLPIGMARGLGAGAGWGAYALGLRRAVSVENAERALGVTRGEARRIVRRSYRNLGRCLMEFAAFRRWSADDVRRMVDVEGLEHLEAARRAGRGALCVTGHFGHWELAGASVCAHGLPMSFLVGEQTNARVNDLMNDLRRAQGIGIITRTSALKKVLTTLRRNEFVALLADQDARRGGIVVEFLGRPASTVRGPALFAIRAGCPIIPLSIYREGSRHRAIFEAPLYPDPARDEEANVLALTRAYTDALSRRIREHPEEYFWPHRRWKSAATQVTESLRVDSVT